MGDNHLFSSTVSKPEFPNLRAQAANKNVKSILKDFDLINQTNKNPHKKLQRSEALIYKIVSYLRKSAVDHLYQTTAIWVLIHVFRMDPQNIREVMVQSGIPGVLHDILKSQLITGSTRQYASELCFYLTSDRPYPLPHQIPKSGPLASLPDIHKSDRYDNSDIYSIDGGLSYVSNRSTMSDMSSSVDGRNGLSAFVPYRIDDTNIKRMKQLFDVDTNEYDKIANSIPNGIIPSRYVFSGDLLLTDPRTGQRMTDIKSFDDDASDISVDDGSTAYSSQNSSNDMFPKNQTLIPPITKNILSSTFSLRSNGLPFHLNKTSMTELNQYSYAGQVESSNHTANTSTGYTTAVHIRDGSILQKPYVSDVNNAFALRQPFQRGEIAHDGHFRDTGSGNKNYDNYEQLDNFSQSQSQLSVQYSEYHNRINAQGAALFHIRAPPTSPTYSMDSTNDFRQTYATTKNSKFRSKLNLPNTRNGVVNGSLSGSVEGASYAGSVYHDGRGSVGPSVYSGSKTTPVSSCYNERSQLDMPESLADLDPLSLNVSIGFHAAFREDLSMTHTIRDGDDDGEDTSDQDDHDDDNNAAGFNDEASEMSDSHIESKLIKNKFVKEERVRMRAEKLIDHSFIKRLFTKKATVADAQSFIHRLEEILSLMDKDNIGFVTWEAFSRTLLALAPQHLLRADVLAFLEAQGCAMNSLIEYKDFIISGKVMVVEKQAGKAVLPVTGWLSRLNQGGRMGDDVAVTWKAHRKWYRQRKALAVVWLMKRATKAFSMGDQFSEAKKFLHHKAKQAHALTFLLYAGLCGMKAEDRRVEAKRHLLLRCLHARRFKVKRDEAFVFLRQSALEVEKEEVRKNMRKEILQRFPGGKAKVQIGIEKVYLRQYNIQQALIHLRRHVTFAMQHAKKVDDALLWLIKLGRQVDLQAQLHEETHSWLLQRADSALKNGILKDGIWKSLIWMGSMAYQYLVRQEEALVWSLQRGKLAKVHEERKDNAYRTLSKQCQSTLIRLNKREDAYTFLKLRAVIALRLESMKYDAIIYLRHFPQAIWNNIAKVEKAHLSLKIMGKKAIVHVDKKYQAWSFLQFIGQRSTIIKRRMAIAYSDLQQIGQQAKLVRFEANWCQKESNAAKIQEEKRKQRALDVENNKRRSLEFVSVEDRWRVELQDAFLWTARLYTPISTLELLGIVDKPEDKIGRIGFRRLLNDGKLIGLADVHEIDAIFASIDPKCKCFLTFEEIWHWFSIVAHERHSTDVVSLQSTKNNNSAGGRISKKGFRFTVDAIFNSEVRATIAWLRRTLLTEAKSYFDENGGMASLDLSFLGGNFDGLFANNNGDDSDSDKSEEFNPKLGDEFGDDENGRLMRRMKLHGDGPVRVRKAKLK